MSPATRFYSQIHQKQNALGQQFFKSEKTFTQRKIKNLRNVEKTIFCSQDS